MAIQLARAIGLQRKPISPLEGLSDIISKAGEGIASSIEKNQAAEQAKAQKEQQLKDAIAANIKVDNNIEAHPLDRERYQNKGMEVTQDVIMKSIEGKMTPMQFKSYADEKQRELDNFKYQAEKDYKALIAGSNPDMRKQFHTTDFDRLIAGTPSTEIEVTSPVDPAEIRMKRVDIERRRKADLEDVKNEDAVNDVNAQYDAELASLETEKPKKKIVEGQRAYFDIPVEERYNNKTDLGLILEKSKIKKSVGVLDAMKDYQNNFEPESLVKVHKDEKGVIVATEDADAIKKSKDKYILSMTSPISYGENHDIEKSALAYSAMRLMEQENIPEEEKPQRLREYIERLAGESFDEMMETTIRNEKRKTNEARLLKEGGGMTFNFGQNETKNDTYIPEDSYDTSVPAESMYNNIEYFKQFERYKRENATQLSKQFNKYGGEEKEDEFYRRKFDEELNKESKLKKGNTVKQNWIEVEKGKLKQYEGSKSISFNNKKEEAVALDVKRDNKTVQRQYIPSRLIYDNKGNIKAVEAYAAVQGADGNYVKKGDSVEIIPMTKRNFDSIRGNFPELLTWSKQNLGIDLKYSQGGAATKPQATKPAAEKTEYVPPKKGDVIGGYEFLGGDDTNPNNWKKIQ